MSVIVPGIAAPTNLRVRNKAIVLESDVYNICDRIKELEPSLYIVLDEDRDKPFVIMQTCWDGVDRFLKDYEVLDPRVLKDIEYMLGVPFEERVKRLERENDEWERKHADEQLEELYERMGGPMWQQLEHDGFIDSRGVSYAKKGVAQAKRHGG